MNVIIPNKLNDKQKEALKAFAKAMGEEIEDKGILGKIKDNFK